LGSLDIASRLARALEDRQEGGRAPEQFTIQVHPEDYKLLERDHPSLALELAEYVGRLAERVGLSSGSRPRIVLTANPALAPHEIEVGAEHMPGRGGQTTQLHRIEPNNRQALSALQTLDAFLIVDGQHHFSLRSPQLMLGRRTDNDVVLDSPSVSRQHAQIRFRHGRFVLFDLGGRGRTAVNGRTVTECVLKPGDVISLSNVLIIYGEGDIQSEPDEGEGQTQIIPRP
jgi:hypothetical protein